MLDEENELDDFEAFDEELQKAKNARDTNKKYAEKISKLVEEKKEELNVTTDDEVRDLLPSAKAAKHGAIERVRLDGITITDQGELVKTKYFDDYDIKKVMYGDITFTPDEAFVLANYYKRMTKGVNAVVPLKCTGPNCRFADDCIYQQMNKAPIGKGCQPPGQTVKTAHHGEVNIEDLDPNIHTIVSFEPRYHAIRGGGNNGKKAQTFKKGQRLYSGQLITIHTANNQHIVTGDHISIARFNENALSKHCVYIMRKGDLFRIGKSQVLKKTTNNKFYLPFRYRMQKEKADAIWIIGVYDTNTEALLAEEYYSVSLQIPKACFLISSQQKVKKWDGLYKWVTQEQLDDHHQKFYKPLCHWDNVFKKLGLLLEFPIYSKIDDYDHNKLNARRPINIRSCNIIPDIMDVPVESGSIKSSIRRVSWQKILSVSRQEYNGIVYSLDVDRYNTYFSGGIATHNCLLEYDLLNYHTNNFMKQFQVSPDDYAEQMLVAELAEIIVYEMRISRILAEPDNAGMMGIRIKFSPDGEMMQEETAHWAVEIKEKFKNRKMKIIEALKKTKPANPNTPEDYQGFISKVSNALAEYQAQRIQEMSTSDFKEEKK